MAISMKRKDAAASTRSKGDDDDVLQDDGAEVIVAARFPRGSAALQDKDDAENVRLVNVSLKVGIARVPDMSRRPKGGHMEKRVYIKPFGVIDMPVHYALRHFSGQEKPNATKIWELAPGPAPSDAGCRPTGKNMVLRFKDTGAQFDTCPFADCPHHPMLVINGKKQTWSVWQAQHLVARLLDGGIDHFISDFDTRNPVVLFGRYRIDRLRAAQRERMGMKRPDHSRAVL